MTRLITFGIAVVRVKRLEAQSGDSHVLRYDNTSPLHFKNSVICCSRTAISPLYTISQPLQPSENLSRSILPTKRFECVGRRARVGIEGDDIFVVISLLYCHCSDEGDIFQCVRLSGKGKRE